MLKGKSLRRVVMFCFFFFYQLPPRDHVMEGRAEDLPLRHH